MQTTPTKIKTKTASIQTLYRCPKRIVAVIRKRQNLHRFPRHNYPCLLFILNPRHGTRVQTAPGGTIEFMPTFDELRAMLIGIDPKFAKILPAFMRNKPIERQRFHDHKNAKRFGLK